MRPESTAKVLVGSCRIVIFASCKTCKVYLLVGRAGEGALQSPCP
jgi:hypothetical protein